MIRAILQVLANAGALYLAARIVPGISYEGGPLYLIGAGLLLGLINLLVKPVVSFLSCPLIALTLGLFYLVINALMLKLADFFLGGLKVEGLLAAILGGCIIAFANWILRAFVSEKKG